MENARSPADSHAPADPQQSFRLESGDVHVWLASIDGAILDDAAFVGRLSDEELNRARQLVFDVDRRRFLISHLLLRALLGRYVGKDAATIQLTHSALGKPLLAEAARVDFNLAHSGGLAAYVFGLDQQVGIDVEQIRPTLDVQALAERYFTPLEARAIRETAEKDRPVRFFTYWVRKEAVLKATGYGLRVPLSAVDVTGDQSRGGAVARLRVGTTPDWHIVDLPVSEEYRAAAAVNQPPRRLSCQQMSSECVIGYC
jgi:4'-phosphopantetheinyl transferase